MHTLRATSVPDKSSRASGSVYPFAFASRTMSENLGRGPEDGAPGENTLKMYERVPERTPSMRCTLSPFSTRSRSVPITGSAAPTVHSFSTCTWNLRRSLDSSLYESMELEKAFLLGVMMLMRRDSQSAYESATFWLAVQSTMTLWPMTLPMEVTCSAKAVRSIGRGFSLKLARQGPLLRMSRSDRIICCQSAIPTTLTSSVRPWRSTGSCS
mmetsp:Transcript_15652/g.27031  ORF Transcript_15652/g.27031 Transcript_15652/m.27031 type:complete len:212 (-) Transcript_15652:1518-2153(-)